MASVVTIALAARNKEARTGLVPVETGILVVLYAAASTLVFTLG